MALKNKPSQVQFWQAPAYLKAIRESFGVSQRELARRTHVTRAVIANVETKVTPLTPKDALALYMLLEALGSEDAKRARLAIEEVLKASIRRELAMVDREVSLLQKRRKSLVDRLAEFDTTTDFLREIRDKEGNVPITMKRDAKKASG